MFILVKATCPLNSNLRAERIRNSDTYTIFLYAVLRLLVYACTRVVKKRASRDTFFRNHEPNRGPEMSLSYSQNMLKELKRDF